MRWLAILLLSCSVVWAFSHGLNTTFNPAQWPGATISTINCTGSDTTAFANWRTAAIAGNPTQQVLHLTGNCVTTPDQPGPLNGIKNVVVWAYGATINRIAIGAGGTSFGAGTGAAFLTASAGATQVTLVNNADGTKFSNGAWVAPTGLQLQISGFPPNFQFFEYKKITGLSGCNGSSVCTITLDSPLTNSYLSTWPVVTGSDGGPATLYPMDTSWDTDVQWFGGTIADSGQVITSGRNIVISDVTFPSTGGNPGIDPTVAQSITVNRSFIGSSELDKQVDTLIFANCYGVAINVQSASVHNLQVTNTNLTGQLFGTPLNATITNLTTPLLAVGPNGYGASTSLTVLNSTITAVRASLQFMPLADFAWNSAGRLAIANNATDIGLAWQMGVPGHKYYLGDNQGAHATPATTFTINTITQDGTNTYWNTDLPSGSLPACSSSPCEIVSWGAMTITQTNTPGVNLTQFAP